MKFTQIDQKTWPRAQMFGYFSQMAPTGYSVTVNTDVTLLRSVLKERRLKFFPAYLWLVTKNLNAQPEFKTAVRNGVLGYYDVLTPLYAAFHEDDKTFSLAWCEFSDSFKGFYDAYCENQSLYGQNKGVLLNPTALPPENAYTVSCVPWVSFTHFAVHSYENKPYYFPSVEAGKFITQNGAVLMPLSLTCHHATTDGYHVGKFIDELQKDMDSFEKYL